MRKELYLDLISRLSKIAEDGSLTAGELDEEGETIEPLVQHIDLWNQNVEFIDQEDSWPRPAVFVEFCPVTWEVFASGRQWRGKCQVRLHLVTDWAGSSSSDSDFLADALKVFDYSDYLHNALAGMRGESYHRLDLVESDTNHNHEEIVETIDTYNVTFTKE